MSEDSKSEGSGSSQEGRSKSVKRKLKDKLNSTFILQLALDLEYTKIIYQNTSFLLTHCLTFKLHFFVLSSSWSSKSNVLPS